MMFACFILLRFRSSARKRILVDGFMLLVIAALTLPQTVLADGCFVFKWDKKIDISEPNQKAIILHDGEREEMLLQVKYQGPLEEFGWLIPVPALPTIVEGSMGPFYELSILTQQQSGGYPPTAGTRSVPQGRPENQVKVIELKTVEPTKSSCFRRRTPTTSPNGSRLTTTRCPTENRKSLTITFVGGGSSSRPRFS